MLESRVASIGTRAMLVLMLRLCGLRVCLGTFQLGETLVLQT